MQHHTKASLPVPDYHGQYKEQVLESKGFRPGLVPLWPAARYEMLQTAERVAHDFLGGGAEHGLSEADQIWADHLLEQAFDNGFFKRDLVGVADVVYPPTPREQQQWNGMYQFVRAVLFPKHPGDHEEQAAASNTRKIHSPEANRPLPQLKVTTTDLAPYTPAERSTSSRPRSPFKRDFWRSKRGPQSWDEQPDLTLLTEESASPGEEGVDWNRSPSSLSPNAERRPSFPWFSSRRSSHAEGSSRRPSTQSNLMVPDAASSRRGSRQD
ncbi:hypothetical protein JCM8547_007308 [Rhodosporidiobolus lusitaniae]